MKKIFFTLLLSLIILFTGCSPKFSQDSLASQKDEVINNILSDLNNVALLGTYTFDKKTNTLKCITDPAFSGTLSLLEKYSSYNDPEIKQGISQISDGFIKDFIEMNKKNYEKYKVTYNLEVYKPKPNESNLLLVFDEKGRITQNYFVDMIKINSSKPNY